VYAETIGDLLHGVDAGLEGPRHGLAADGVALGEGREGLGEWPGLGAWHFAQPFPGIGRNAVALHEPLTAEEDLMAPPFPDARLSYAKADEGLGGLRAGTLLAELPRHSVGLQPRRSVRS
jgi:hypothetical protein